MTYQDQLDRGLSVFHCDECAEAFWLKPGTAQARTCQGKKLWCRECFSKYRDDCPAYPFARRLMPDELKEYEWIRYHAEPVESAPSPQPTMELSTDMDRLRVQVSNTLKLLGWEGKQFAKEAKVNSETLDKLLDGKLSRALQDRVVQRIRAKLAELYPEPRDEQTQEMVDKVFGETGQEPEAEPVEEPTNPLLELTWEERVTMIKLLPEPLIKKLKLL